MQVLLIDDEGTVRGFEADGAPRVITLTPSYECERCPVQRFIRTRVKSEDGLLIYVLHEVREK